MNLNESNIFTSILGTSLNPLIAHLMASKEKLLMLLAWWLSQLLLIWCSHLRIPYPKSKERNVKLSKLMTNDIHKLIRITIEPKTNWQDGGAFRSFLSFKNEFKRVKYFYLNSWHIIESSHCSFNGIKRKVVDASCLMIVSAASNLMLTSENSLS